MLGVEDDDWNRAVDQLSAAADGMAVLSRCLDVAPQLREWRTGGEALAGGDAANALDQARGDLERLIAGDASVLLRTVEQLLAQLPTPWE